MVITKFNEKKIVFLVVSIGILLRVVFVLRPMELLVTLPPDDALYYFKVAQNIVGGFGSTFDKIHPTNGYHPLWLGVLVVVATFIKDSALLLRIGLTISVLFSTISAITLYVFLKKLVARLDIALLGVVLYFFNPRVVVSSLNGLETSLTTLLFALTIVFVTFWERFKMSDTKKMIAFGTLLGLLFLARTDTMFYIVVFFILFVMKVKQIPLVHKIMFVSVPVAIITLPWIVWNVIQFGTFIQVSGSAIPYVFKQQFIKDGFSRWDIFVESIHQFTTFITSKFSSHMGYPVHSFLFVYAIWLIFSIKNSLQSTSSAMQRLEQFVTRSVWLLSIAALLLIFVHTFVRWYPRQWYFDQIIYFSAIAFSFIPLYLDKNTYTRKIRTYFPSFISILLVGILVGSTIISYKYLSRGVYPHQQEMYDAAQWMRKRTQRDDMTAAFNAGILGYFSERTVINLDGVINNAAFYAMKTNTLADLLLDNDVDYYVDYDPIMRDIYADMWGENINMLFFDKLVLIDREGVSWQNNNINVFRIVY